jgi:hypothetical protein
LLAEPIIFGDLRHANVPFVEAFYLEKASRRGRMLTFGGKSLDFAEKTATDRQ